MEATQKHYLSHRFIQDDTGYSAVHIRRLEKSGNFPPRVKIGSGPNGRVVWVASDYYAWRDQREAHR